MYHHLEQSSLCQGLCLLLTAWVVITGRCQGELTACSSVDQSPPCIGERPLLFNGCCPIGAWHSCRPSLGESCDRQLGLDCRDASGTTITDGEGICHGETGLRVMSRGESVFDLDWTDFAVGDYTSEYVILYRAGSNHQDLDEWRQRELGYETHCSLFGLKPATLYFIKVAIWEDARAAILGNTSETIYAETLPVEFCTDPNGEFHLVGEETIHECGERCVCLPTGVIDCSPLCQEQDFPEVEEGCHVRQGESCCDYRVTCQIGEEPCIVNGTSYPEGSEFSQGCEVCTCHHGEVDCVLPEECQVPEGSLQCENPEIRQVEGRCCPEYYCAEQDDQACVYEGESYGYLEYFSSQQCGLCQCHGSLDVRCAPECPPVVMVLPDAACPDPHIRQEGCCSTLHCHDPSTSLAFFLSRMFAQSYSPVSLTLSFEVNPQSEVSDVPLYCIYEIMYANTSDPNTTWHRRLVQPIDVRMRQDQARSHSYLQAAPLDALTRDNAIVVGGRAYVTLSGMSPDTTYYVRIRPLDESYNGVVMDGDPAANETDKESTAMVVVKTMSLNNAMSCDLEGLEVRHGEKVSENCSHSCSCSFGQNVCENKCEAEQFVVAKSLTCPQPRLEKPVGQCCPEWRCYPSDSGCLHKGLLMRSGQSITESCSECTCLKGNVSCELQCPDSGTAPRPDCELVHIEGYCCPQWRCLIENHPPYGAKSSIIFYLNGECQSPTASQDIQVQVLEKSTLLCLKEDLGGTRNQCNNLEAKVYCPGDKGDALIHRKKRDANQKETENLIQVQILLSTNFSTEVPKAVAVKQLQVLDLLLTSVLNSTLEVLTPDGQLLTPVRVEGQSEIVYACHSGFSFRKGKCVLTEIESTLFVRKTTKMTLSDVTDNSALLVWESLSDRAMSQVSGLMVEFRLKSQMQWSSSGQLVPSRTVYLLQNLKPGETYDIRLVANTTVTTQGRWVLAQLSAKTLPKPKGHGSIARVNFKEINPTNDGCIISWDLLGMLESSEVLDIELSLKMINHNSLTKRLPVSEGSNTAELSGLLPYTVYTVQLVFRMKTQSDITSGLIYFVTTGKENDSAKLVGFVAVSSFAGFVLGAMVMLVCVWYRKSKTVGFTGGFINNTFGSHMEKDGQSSAI